MAEAGEENKPKRCNCGFWGSPQTMNMCSTCYKAHLLKKGKARVENTQAGTTAEQSAILKQLGLVSSPASNISSNHEKTDNQEKEEKKEEVCNNPDSPFLPIERPQQKNKKKCWICKVKLELAQRELGSCKCGYVYCFLHRLPEQHTCIYDHKEGGRQHAMKAMVPASKKKIGRSFHRMDSRPE